MVPVDLVPDMGNEICSRFEAGTALLINKVVGYNALDDVHADALGEVYAPWLKKTARFYLTLNYGPETNYVPWDVLSPTPIHAKGAGSKSLSPR